MKTYQHTQPAMAIVVAMGVFSTGLAIGAIFVHLLIISAILVAIVGWVFRSLTIEISDSELAWHFGSGFLRKARAVK